MSHDQYLLKNYIKEDTNLLIRNLKKESRFAARTILAPWIDESSDLSERIIRPL
jgi:hypothetical protein